MSETINFGHGPVPIKFRRRVPTRDYALNTIELQEQLTPELMDKNPVQAQHLQDELDRRFAERFSLDTE